MASPPFPPPARLPVPACSASQQRGIPVPQHPGPTGTARHMPEPFPWSQFSLQPQTNQTPSQRTGFGAVTRHRFGNFRREPGADKELRALPSPPQAAAPHGPRLGFVAPLAGCRGPGAARSPPSPSAQGTAVPGTLGTKAKHRPSPWPLRGEAALVLPAAAAVPAGSWGRPRCLTGSTSTRPPGASLLCSPPPPSRGTKTGLGVGGTFLLLLF